MAENAYVFFHPQYGGLRVVNNEEELIMNHSTLIKWNIL